MENSTVQENNINEEMVNQHYDIKDPIVYELVLHMISGMSNIPTEWNHLIRKAQEGKRALINAGVIVPCKRHVINPFEYYE